MLAVVLGALAFSSLNLYRQLQLIVTARGDLTHTQGALYGFTAAQYGEEAELRAYVVSRESRPFVGDTDTVGRRLADLTAAAEPLGLADLNASIAKLFRLHHEWDQEIAEPLIAHPDLSGTPLLETRRKFLSDATLAETNHAQRVLDDRLDAAQRELGSIINQIMQAGLLSLLFFGAFGVLFVGLRTRMLNRIRRERSIIETLQGAFRAGMDPLPGARLGTAYTSATADAAVGGDIFDTWALDDHRGLVLVADISGKGLDAAVNTALVKYAVRTLSSTTDAPDAILAGFNRVFMQTIKDPCLFVAAFVGVVDARAMTLRYASAGHAGAFMRRGSTVTQLPVTGPLIGLDPAFAFGSGQYALKAGDVLVLATDGFSEARTKGGTMLPDEQALALVKEASPEPQRCADELIAAVRRHSGGKLADDLALLVVAVDGLPASASVSSSAAA